jgi:hypothetical protein
MAKITINLKFMLDTNIFVMMIYKKLQRAAFNGKLLTKGTHTSDTDSCPHKFNNTTDIFPYTT